MLTSFQRDELYNLRTKLLRREANSSEMKKYLDLITQANLNNKYVLNQYAQNVGYNSIDDFKNDLSRKSNNELINGLVMIGGAVLLASILSKK
uniref:Uncharacterized protein n=1 Tax=Methanococcus maripaludis (strain C6 / ATCC BAA-1332) TaxID=444158 RepID=A9A7U7_METM6